MSAPLSEYPMIYIPIVLSTFVPAIEEIVVNLGIIRFGQFRLVFLSKVPVCKVNLLRMEIQCLINRIELKTTMSPNNILINSRIACHSNKYQKDKYQSPAVRYNFHNE